MKNKILLAPNTECQYFKNIIDATLGTKKNVLNNSAYMINVF